MSVKVLACLLLYIGLGDPRHEMFIFTKTRSKSSLSSISSDLCSRVVSLILVELHLSKGKIRTGIFIFEVMPDEQMTLKMCK